MVLQCCTSCWMHCHTLRMQLLRIWRDLVVHPKYHCKKLEREYCSPGPLLPAGDARCSPVRTVPLDSVGTLRERCSKDDWSHKFHTQDIFFPVFAHSQFRSIFIEITTFVCDIGEKFVLVDVIGNSSGFEPYPVCWNLHGVREFSANGEGRCERS